ncbi:hypothetical protein BS47DRAFT_1301379 [Hydnum rufescens UP504]|uniref:DUF803-domain-containing protein n=1 Tax=Hydnum rufescens UP504 TaxID=1448309 RepID=A0A9P6APC6_9AGAM|nr:hypothetical protein BS47DRAFT_1301379 [Hydnum rufescens UP504]
MDADEIPEAKSESAYLKSKLWWFGFALMNIGEFGNFLSYAYAPASVVAPLGAFALIANCLFAPLLLKEKFRPRDVLGLALCIVGVVTIVLASKSSDVRLDPDGLIHAVSQRLFIVYSVVCIILASILALLSDRPVGHQHVWIDLGLCALFGGYTVLSTKGISTLVSLEWIQIYRYWITYPILLVLIATGVGQIRYLNRALMKFDSKVVIPTQFVLFNFTAIVGSAVLYGDFDSIPFERMVIFLYGCASTFLGVFILAQPSSSDSRTGSPLLRPTLDGRGRTNASSPSRRNIIPAHSYPSPSSTTPSRPTTPLRPNVSLSIPPSRPSHVLPLRPRASSTGLGLSPAAQYLLIGSGSTSPNVSTSLMNGSPFVVSPSTIRGGQAPPQQPPVQSQAPSLSRSQSYRESDGRA